MVTKLRTAHGSERQREYPAMRHSVTMLHCFRDASTSSQDSYESGRFTHGPAGTVSDATTTQLTWSSFSRRV